MKTITNINQIINNLIPGFMAGIFSVIYCISFAALIFSGDFITYFPQGVNLLLFTAITVSAFVALFSSFSSTVAAPQKTTAAVLSLLGSSIIINMPETASLEDKFLTFIAAIIFNSLLSGVFFWILGWFNLGKFIRFIPYPVIGGFMAGSGWLLLEGSFRLMTGISLHLTNLLSKFPALFKPNLLIQWLPGVLFAILLMVILPRYQHFLVLPLTLLFGFVLYHIVLLLTGITIAVASHDGLLLGPFPKTSNFQFFTISALYHANWLIVFSQFNNILALCLINAIALLLNASGVELIAEKDIDLDRELKVAGIASIFSAIGGGIGGFHSLSQSSLAYRLGGRSRLVGFITSAVCLMMLIMGVSCLSIVPKAIIGGILFYLGLEFIIEWLYKAWFRLSLADYFIVLLIFFVVAAVGYLEGVGVGTLAATVLFAINCSQMEIIKRIFSGSSYRSNVQRTIEQEKQLREKGEQIYIIELQGLLFFGTANQLLRTIRSRLEATDSQPIQYLIIDFCRCTGLDASGVISFSKLQQVTNKQDIHLIFTNINLKYQKQLEQSQSLDIQNDFFHIFPDLDRGLEWCEDEILNIHGTNKTQFLSLSQQLKPYFSNPYHIVTLITYLKPINLEENDYLFRQGDPFDGLYFLESGRISIIVELPNGKTKRVRSYTKGNTIGEMGLYRQAPRTASVIADQPSLLYFLSNHAFTQLEADEPLVAASFHRFIVHLLAERLHHTVSKN